MACVDDVAFLRKRRSRSSLKECIATEWVETREILRGKQMKSVRLASAFILAFGLLLPEIVRSQSLSERLTALGTSDPELYALFVSLYQGRQERVAGGFDYDFNAGSLQCQDGFDGGLSECSLDIDIEAKSQAEHPDSRRANLQFDCEVELQTVNTDGIFSSLSEYADATISLRQGRSGSETISFSFYLSTYTPTVRASVERWNCELVSID